jgi:PHD/YefM family antitoxin component YafN of YafNO toxin-antitoxin module
MRMIQLPRDQLSELAQHEPVAIDPETKQTYVLVRKQVYERMKEQLYDDSSWTDEEMELLAAEVDAMLDDDMAIEDVAS